MRTVKALFLALAVAFGLQAQRAPLDFDPEKGVKIALNQGAVAVTVPEGVHLKAAFMEVKLASKPGTLTVGKLPPTQGVDEVGDGIWHGTVRIPVSGQGLKDPVKLEVTYQPCTEGDGGVCFAPTTRVITVKAADIPGNTAAAQAPAPVDPTPQAVAEAPKAEAPAPAAAPVAASKAPDSGKASKGLLLMLLAAFGWGLAASLTPCVYPMIPITMAIVGAKGSGKAKGFALSLSLVLGIAVTYTLLGVIAAKLGSQAGAFAQTPWFLVPVSVLFALFALSLFGLFEIKLPDALTQKLQGNGPRTGFGGAFVMGLVLGPLAAPCVGPFVGTVLVDIAQKGSVALGALNLFVFALGMGVLFMAVGTFSAGLPKSGEWMIRFKQAMGVLVLGFAVWNIRLLVPEWASFLMWSLTALVAAAVLGAFEAASGLFGQFRRGLALLALAAGVLLGLRSVEGIAKVDLLPRGGAGTAAGAEAHEGWFEQDFEAAKAQAKADGKLLLVDIYAEWCGACKELDEKTWPDPAVKAWLRQNAVAVRIDTHARRKDLAKDFKVAGYPTVMLMDANGQEIRPRLMGFEKPEAMLKWLAGK